MAIFGEQAEGLADRLSKGALVYVEGRLKLSTWTGKDGVQRSELSCTAWLVQPLGQISRHATKAASEDDDVPF